jgi:hypothetical protein
MADEQHVVLLKQGVEAWNEWREKNLGTRPDLSGADLTRAHLRGADLTGADLTEADLTEADLSSARLFGADLSVARLLRADLTRADLVLARLFRTDLTKATLVEVNFTGAHLCGTELTFANLNEADFSEANLSWATLSGADLSGTRLVETMFGNTDLSHTRGLDRCIHEGPSTIDHRTLQQSGPLPLVFLRGVGLPDNLIDYLPSLLNQPIQFYSVFISYSGKDQKFADRLHADIQDKGVRCWFAPHDLPIGARTWDAIDEAIRLRDKVLLILSRHAIGSDWVEDEVTRAFAEERARKEPVLFPIRLDDAVMETTEAWARKLRDNRNIGDFRRWKDHDAYAKALERVLRDLKVTQAVP